MNLDHLPPEYRAQVAAQLDTAPKANKYRNQKVLVDGIKFDSKAEARRYQELKLLQEAGEIYRLTLQPEYELQPAFKDADGKRHRAIKYRADFQYVNAADGHTIVEDVKGYRTADYKIKAKLFRFRYQQAKLVEVKA